MSCYVPVIDPCPPSVCCPRPDYSYAVETLNIWQTANYGVNTTLKPEDYEPNELAVSRLIRLDDPDLVLLIGNHRYPPADYRITVEPFYGQMRNRRFILPIPGSEDYSFSLTPEGAEEYKSYFNPAQFFPPNTQGNTYYKYSLAYVDFFMLDSGMDNADVTQHPDMLPKPSSGDIWIPGPCGTRELYIRRGCEEWVWFVKSALASKARWKIVCINHPPFSSGAVHGAYPDLQWQFEDLGIDLVISAHESVYERIEKDGIVYVVNGLGGAPIGTFSSQIDVDSKVRFNGEHGALNLRISKQTLAVRFLTADGATKDSFKLTKSDE